MTLAYFIDCIGWTLVHFVWQGALIGALTAATLAALRHARATARYNVACAALLACVLWPAAELSLRLQGADMVTAQMRFADALLASGGAERAGLSTFLQQQIVWIVALWAGCASLLSARMALGLAWVARRSHADRGDPALQAVVSRLAARFDVSRAVRLRVVNDLASPQTAGWWRPVILVPASLVTGMPADLLEALLAHEMAHIRRLDYVVNLAQNAVEVIFFYQPAVWWISNRIRAEREHIADDLAARHMGAPRTLARALSELERLQFSASRLTVAANGGDLLERVRRLVRPDARTSNWAALVPVAGIVAACLSVYAHAGSSADIAIDQLPLARFSTCAKPQYPQADLAAGNVGTVDVSFDISATGIVRAARIKRSSGHAGLDEAARLAIARCSFSPAMAGGLPVPATTSVQYVWTLE